MTGAGRLLCRALGLLYLMAPAYVANMSALLSRFWPGWNRPIDVRWLGSHKTVVGFAAGVLGATLTTLVQQDVGGERTIPIGDVHWLELGVRFGVGAMGGDTAKSFFKRLLGIAPGTPWIPFDQLDFVLGAWLLVAPHAAVGPADLLFVLAATFVGHIVTNHLAYALGIRDVKW